MPKTLLFTVIAGLLLAGCAAAEPTATSAPTAAPIATATSKPTEMSEYIAIGDQEIVFTSEVEGNEEIFAINADGTGLLQVTHTQDREEYYPQWSPNGEIVAFISTTTGGLKIASINKKGEWLGEFDFPACSRTGFPIWSPDSQWMALDCDTFIGLSRPDGSDMRIIDGTYRTEPELIHWSPDSTKIGIRTLSSIVISDLEGNKTEFESGFIGRRSAPDTSLNFDISPNGEYVAYIYNHWDQCWDCTEEEEYIPGTLLLFSMQEKTIRQISPFEHEIDFSYPEYISENQILVIGLIPKGGDYFEGQWRFFIINSENMELFDIAPDHNLDLYADTYSVSPSNKWLAFTSQGALWLLDFQSKEIRPMIDLKMPNRIKWLKNEKQILIATSEGSLVVNIEDGSSVRIADLNSWLDVR